MCEPKRRAEQEKEKGVQLGFNAYVKFYDSLKTNNRIITYEDFSKSPYYLAFVKFGRHLVAIRAVNVLSFTDWLIRNGKKLDNWCNESLYDEWLNMYLPLENLQDALERALSEMQKYAEDDDSPIKNNFADYFRCGKINRICLDITAGRISPWVVYNCESGVDFLDRLNETQIGVIIKYIDPQIWTKKFRLYNKDVEWAKNILKYSGL